MSGVGLSLVLSLLFSLPSPVQDQGPEACERRIFTAVQAGESPAMVLTMCQNAVKLYPQRPYLRAVMGDSLFHLRQLRAAQRTYEAARQMMNESQRHGSLGNNVQANLRRVTRQVKELERGIALEHRALWAGWISLALLAVLVLGIARLGEKAIDRLN